MSFDILLKRVGKVAAENSPAILAALGVSGTLTTAYLAAKGAFKASDDIRTANAEKHQKFLVALESEDSAEADELNGGELTTQEKAELTWKCYIPAAASAALTVSAIILAVRVQERRNAALAAAYTTVEKSYAEYRAKNLEKIGKKKEQEVRDEIAQDKMNQTDLSRTPIILTKKGDTLCMDGWSGRPFSSSRNIIDKAVNDFNRTLNNNDFASLSEFWALLDLPPTSDSDYVGWNRETGLLELDWSAVVDENDEPALVYTFKTMPESRFMSAF
jgi:Family of unknown function (DUF6353)